MEEEGGKGCRYQGYVGAYLLIAGVDENGPELYEVHAHGSTTQGPFAADGSGSLCAMAVLETRFKAKMSEEEAVDLVSAGLKAGQHGDLASGNSFRYVVITKDASRVVKDMIPDFCQSTPKSPSSSSPSPSIPFLTLCIPPRGVLKYEPATTVKLSEKEKWALRKKVKAKAFNVVEEMDVSPMKK